MLVVLKNTFVCCGCCGCWVYSNRLSCEQINLRLSRGGGELGHGLGSLRHSVLGELSGKEKSDGGLDLSGGESGLLGVAGKLGSLKSESFEDIVDEGVEDGHASLGDACLGVHLLEHLVDVRGVRLYPGLLAGLAAHLLWGLRGLLSCIGCLRHLEDWLR